YGNSPPSFTTDVNSPLVVEENTPPGTIVSTLEGVDPEGSKVKYGIYGTDRFSLDRDSGELRVAQPLDREVSTIVLDTKGSKVKYGIYGTDWFSLDRDSGELRVAQPLYRERASKSSMESTVQIGSLWSLDRDSGELRVAQPLDREDGHHTSKTNVDIRVGDVQNTPPIFINSSFSGEIMESAPIGSVVLRVEAKDGDLAQPRSIYYDLLTNPDEFFLIDSNTGELKTAKPLDREILGGTNGVISLTVRAREMVDGKPLQEDQATAFAQVTVTILDVNDSPPVFNRKEYVVHIPEDIPDGSLLPDLDMIVTDSDLGMNSAFSLRLEDVSKSFSVERPTFYGMVIAEETHTAEKLSSSATLIVQVTDVNDNVPSFELNAYTGNVLETAQAGTSITTITALDSDGGDYGTGGIVYELLGEYGIMYVRSLDSDGGDYGTGGIVYELLALDSDSGDYGTGGIVYELLALDSDGGDYGTGGIVYELLALDSDGGDYGTGGIVYELLALDSDSGDYGTGGIVYELLALDSDGGDYGTGGIVYELLALDSDGGDYGTGGIVYELLVLQHWIVTAGIMVQVALCMNYLVSTVLCMYDNIPTGNVLETAQAGTSITTITALDSDGGDYGTGGIVYELLGEHADKFLINPKLGQISVGFCSTPGIAPCLDYETQPVYNLTVKATDNLGQGNNSTVPLTITLSDANDNPPEFTQEAYAASIYEGVIAFEPRLVIQATDPDKTSVIEYSLEDTEEQLAIDSTTGEISITSPNGLEIITPQESIISLVVKATDGMFVSKVPVTIQVIDVNNNQPTFEHEIYNVNIPEDVQMGASLLKLSAHDNDEGINAELSYRIEKGSNNDFNINNTTGVLYASSKLDYDKRDKYTLHVIAVDAGTPPLTGSTTVNIAITNVNDKEPYFTPTTQRAEKRSASLLKLSAHDNDEGINAELSYRIEKGSNNDFNINNTTGVLYASSKLDYDKRDKYTLHVIAVDAGTPSLTGSTTVNIAITNVNDKEPYFTPTTQRAEVLENVPVGTVIHKLVARDMDISDPEALSYSWGDASSAVDMSGNEVMSEEYKDLFSVDPKSGWVSVAKPLSRDIAVSVKLSIVVTDNTAPMLQQGMGTLIISIIDVNDIPPEFEPPWTRDEPNYLLEVEEEQPIGSLLGKFTALDKDSSIALYVLEQDGDLFSVNNITGEVFIQSRLDYETIQSVNFTLVAYDSGIPQLSTAANVYVQLININDNTPVFSQNSPIGHLVTKVKAEDGDSGENGRVTYHFNVNGSQVQHTAQFSIDPDSGAITTRAMLDREEKSSYQVYLVARDHGSPMHLESMQPLLIYIEDEDDHQPVFETSNRTIIFFTKENVPLHSRIGKQIETSNRTVIFFTKENVPLHSRIGKQIETSNRTVIFFTKENVPLHSRIGKQIETSNRTVIFFTKENVPLHSRIGKQIETSNRTVIFFTKENVPLHSRIGKQIETSNRTVIFFTKENVPLHSRIGKQIETSNRTVIFFTKENVPLHSRIGKQIETSNRTVIFFTKENVPLHSRIGKQIETSNRTVIFFTKENVPLHSRIGKQIETSNRTVIFFTKENVPLHSRIGKQIETSNRTVIFFTKENVPLHSRIGKQIETSNRTVIFFTKENVPLHSRIGKQIETSNRTVIFFTKENVPLHSRIGKQIETSNRTVIFFTKENVPLHSRIGKQIETSNRTVIFFTKENVPLHSRIGKQIETSNRTVIFFTKENVPLHSRIGKVQAIDLDEGNNSIIFYFIISGNDNGSFQLDKRDGSIYNQINMDRETQAMYEIFIKASSDENYAENENNSSDDDNSVVLVRILVEDENDNPPEFDQPQYYRGVSSYATAHHMVTQVSATDPDSGDFAHFVFLIQASHLYKAGSKQSSGSVVPAPFSIDEIGRVYTTQRMAEYNQDRFKLEVVARETSPPYREATALVHVWIYEPQQLIKIILSRPPAEVITEQSEIVRDLSNATSTLVVVDDIKEHLTPTGELRRDWTDMFVHVVDMGSEEIAAIPHILRIIDSKYDFLKAYYVGVAIENVLPAHPSVQGKPYGVSDLSRFLCVSDVFAVDDSGILTIQGPLAKGKTVYNLLVQQLIKIILSRPPAEVITEQSEIVRDLSNATSTLVVVDDIKEHLTPTGELRRDWTDMFVHVVDMGSEEIAAIPHILRIIDSNDLSITENPLWIEQKLKLYEEQELTMQVFCDLDRGSTERGGGGGRRDSIDNLSGADNTYATIQGGAGDYATLGGSIIPLDNVSSHSQQMYEASLGFQGSTFQVPKSNEILRKPPPLPSPPSEEGKDTHQPEFILELI
ncbi:cadherin-87A-like, partial [Diaphorina citri]|uniref:Cadherin-87A-like n=1 Tax=Diaphorina citri TaxID=121845 RepID=A0A3Q0JBW1_DIACI